MKEIAVVENKSWSEVGEGVAEENGRGRMRGEVAEENNSRRMSGEVAEQSGNRLGC